LPPCPGAGPPRPMGEAAPTGQPGGCDSPRTLLPGPSRKPGAARASNPACAQIYCACVHRGGRTIASDKVPPCQLAIVDSEAPSFAILGPRRPRGVTIPHG
jgi:hypothetical protein